MNQIEHIPLLDHGHVTLIDHMGDDDAIVQAARVSYGKGTKTLRENRELIRYMYRHDHMTPFESVVFKFGVRCPIFVGRQWVRYRASTFNEVSGRYSLLPSDTYIPDADQICSQSKKNKQGRGDPLGVEAAEKFQAECWATQKRAFDDYDYCLRELDVARETARINLPLSTYTEFHWQVNLRNLFNFLSQRTDSHAQYEIRVYADAICDLIEPIVPDAFEAFDDYDKRREGLLLTGPEIRALSGQGTEGMTGREMDEFRDKLARMGLTHLLPEGK